ncbi:MAG: hypothetical protein HGB22_03560 [Chlorobiaceae bacterium]|nr:hypothetical protein [Chlorobiaceae bacterium]
MDLKRIVVSRRRGLFSLLLLLLIGANPVREAVAVDRLEGGYVGSRTEGDATTPVWNFVRNFEFNQYFYAEPFQFDSYNNERVDKMNFSYFVGHGTSWQVKCQSNWVDLRSAGATADKGWGDRNAEFVTLHACNVVASPLEVADWYSAWTNSKGVFDGVHQVMGFRTTASQSCDQDISEYFGSRVKAGAAVWQAWFDAIALRGNGSEKGAAVMYPPSENDSYAVTSYDPPADHTWLRIWYQY